MKPSPSSTLAMVWLLAACICHNRLQVSPYDQEWVVVVVGTDSGIVTVMVVVVTMVVMVVLEWKVGTT